MPWGTKRPKEKTAQELLIEAICWMPQMTAKKRVEAAPALARSLVDLLEQGGYVIERRRNASDI
jgi:hypothetical protein